MGPFRPSSAGYLWTVVAAGTLVILISLRVLVSDPLPVRWFVLAVLTILSGAMTIKIRSADISFSLSDTFIFTAVLLFGPAAGTVTVALDGAAGSMRLKRPVEPSRLLFNIAAPSLAMWIASQVLFAVTGPQLLSTRLPSVGALLAPMALCAALFFVFDTGLVAGAIALQQKRSVLQVWREHFLKLWLSFFGGAYVAALLVANARDLDLGFLAYLIPIPIILAYTFRTSLARIDDQVQHLSQMNRHYQATIEAFAQAVDAKDEVTHGHIRRVQDMCLKLAVALGVTDDRDLKAIEIGALLHDLGKLTVPEHILNKPGKLTPSEFEQMKAHAAAGADILSTVDFPYPVAPIVRHHHENWDGGGYPDGLRGTDIPLAARILSVVDCFDALTSDRPYRLRLTPEEAIEILIARRGSMYDADVVDVFLRLQPTLTESHTPSAGPAVVPEARRTQPEPSRSVSAPDEAEGLRAVFRLGTQLGAKPAEPAQLVCRQLLQLIPASICAFYAFDVSTDRLTVSAAAGPGADDLLGFSMGKGERVTGWVAATGDAAVNSDARLDLAERTRHFVPALRSALSVCVMRAGVMRAVVTMYAPATNPFTEQHASLAQSILHIVAEQIDLSSPAPTRK